MLSNTAVPIYYGRFREAVLNGRIPVNKELSMEMNRIDSLIKNPEFWYDSEAINGFIEYCEKEMVLTDGSPVTMLFTYKLWAEQIFGWYYFTNDQVYEPDTNGISGHYKTKTTKRRLTTKQVLIVGRGASKTLYDAFIHSFFLNIDMASTHQITTAPTMRQANEVLSPIKTAITISRGPLFKMLTEGSIRNTSGASHLRPKLVSTKKGIENTLTSSLLEVLPMTIDKLQGLRVKIASVDEWLSCEIRENPLDAIEQGATKNQNGVEANDYLILATSSEGTIRNGVGDSIKMELMQILKGEYYSPQTSIWWYKLDSIEEINNPAMWIKANPNLGITVDYSVYQKDVEKAEKVPSARNDILAKRFGIPTEGFTYYFTYEETLPHPKKNFWGMPCSLGGDMSLGDDFCAFTFLFPLNTGFGVKTLCFISSLTYSRLQPAVRDKYDEFIREGSLIICEGAILDMMYVYDELENHINERQYDVRCFGYDPYNAEEFVQRWCRENSPYGVEKVRQGSRTESVPLGELKRLASERMLIFDELIMMFAMGNCIVLEDTNGNRKLMKKRYEEKIDPVSAMMDAFVAYKHNKDEVF